jgi:hypothetical protein
MITLNILLNQPACAQYVISPQSNAGMPYPTPAPAPAPAPTPAFSIGNFGFNAAAAGANYSFGSNYSQYGINGGLLSSPCPGGSQFEFDAGFHPYSHSYSYTQATSVYSYSQNGDILDLNAIYFWNQCDWRFGPTAGYHTDTWSYSDYTATSYNSHAFNIGGYGQLLPQNNFTGSAKLGYAFTDNNGYSENGFYAGLDIGYYFCPEFDLCGGFDYTNYSALKVYSFRGEYQLSQTTPFAVSAGYNLSAYPNSSSTGSYSLGLKYNWNIPTSTTLEDRQSTGLLTSYQYKF